jgi:hypothetical protein
MSVASSRFCLVSLSACLLLFSSPAFSADVPGPKITKVSVQDKTLSITVSVPKGWQSVTLESRKAADQGAWVPRSILRGKPLAAKVTFQLPSAYKHHVWRVRGERKSALPLSFFAGKRSFSSKASSLWRSNLGIGNVYALRGDGNLAVETGIPSVPDTRQVSESDIWKRVGDTLYVFNQYRGLQAIDLRDPDAPVLLGELSLPAVGEQLYVLDSGHVALLARDPAAYDKSMLLIVDVSGGALRLASTVSLEGSVCESRLVGTALYVALQGGVAVDSGGVVDWQYGTAVTSIDLSAPAAPVQRSRLWYPGVGTAVMATDRFLFLALQGVSDESAPEVNVIDITPADGTMVEASRIATAGRVADKFKMNLSGTVFSVFSESFEVLAGDPSSPRGTWSTTLETFSLADATNPVPLGVLKLAPGERLHATRFDGDRAYAVTFKNVDPLWVIDLADPSQPVVAGEVAVPGWSTYIQPLGGRLVTVGVEDGHTAVSLFDVSDPAQAVLSSRVLLGGDASWSEANWDEKAFSVFKEEGLILIPFEGWSNGVYASQATLIDLGDTTLTARGLISGNRSIRRTLLYGQRLFALSGKELLSVDIADRDHPAVKAGLELSRTVNRILASGDYLLQLEEASTWTLNGQAALRVAAKATPDAILKRVDLGPLPVVGACVRDGYLHVLQDPGMETNLVLTVMDLSALPEISTASQVEVPAPGRGYGSFEAVWPAPGLLVWVSRSSGVWAVPMVMDRAVALNPATKASAVTMDAVSSFRMCPWWYAGGVQFLAVKTADPAHPEFVSQYRCEPSLAWGFSEPFVAQGCVYLSHEQSGQVRVVRKNGQTAREWRVGEWLDVIDFTDPAHPTARPAVSIPGQLAGLSPDGALLYTLGSRLAYSPDAREETEALCACAYDGVTAYLVGTLPVPRSWPRPVRVDDRGRVFLGRTFSNAGRAPVLESWSLSGEGLFELKASAACKAPVSELNCFGDLLASQDTSGGLSLFDTSDPAQLKPCGESEVAGGLWASLSRAWGSLADGLRIPLDDYGLLSVERK